MNEEKNHDDSSGEEEDGSLPDLDTTPGEFLFFGLEIEHQQCVAILPFDLYLLTLLLVGGSFNKILLGFVHQQISS